MYNRYDGNTGRVVRMPDPEPPRRSPLSVPMRTAGRPAAVQPQRPAAPAGVPRPAMRPGMPRRPPPGGGGGLLGGLGGLGNLLPLGGLGEKLGGLLPKLSLDKLETEDLILLLMLYLMYKESGDKELLIVLGAMLLL